MTHRSKFFENLVVLDTETTGKDYKIAEVIELGLAMGAEGSQTTYAQLFKPDLPISAECSAITNISNRMVEQCDSFRNYLKGSNPLEGLVAEDYLMVAHNAFYDDKVIERYGVKFRRTLCTLAIAKKLFKDDTSITALNLPYLRYRFEILDPADETVANAHRADADALVTYHLLSIMITMMEDQGIIDENKDYYSQITAWLKQPTIIEVMPFGKHKGKKLSEIPNSYWTWAFENMDTFDENSEKYDEDFTNSVLAAIESKLS